MSFLKKKKILITHDGTFHADDLFATATLSILNKGNIKIIRTRDSKEFPKGDYVYDVGGENNPLINKFDHHQKGGGGIRENGIPYASFGLVWKVYGEKICGNKEVADYIDRKIVQSIDATDEGFDLVIPKIKNVFPYSAESLLLSVIPTWKEESKDIDKIFNNQVKKVVDLLIREIKIAKDDIDGINSLLNYYNKSENKKIIIAESDFPRYLLQNTLSKLPEPIYLVYPSSKNNSWKVEAIKKSSETMESRKYFPESWRGFTNGDERLKEITGVNDIIFCHQNGFYLNTESRESAIKLAEKALLA
jgi:uncharacterized UPF0160 family protein